MPKRHPKRLATRNLRIYNAYAQKYMVEGKRSDVCHNELADEFGLEPSTIYTIILEQKKK